MRFKTMILEFAGLFILIFIIASVVSYLYSLLVHGAGQVDWESSVRFGIILGIVVTWINARNPK